MYLLYLPYLHIHNVQVATNLVTLQTCLTSMMGRPITMDQLRQDVGTMVEKITKVITTFRNFRLTMQEYVCLKVVAMLTTQEGIESGSSVDSIGVIFSFSGIVQDKELEQIHDRYMNCLKTFIEYNFPQEPNRVQELLVKLPEVCSDNFALCSLLKYFCLPGARGGGTIVRIQNVLCSILAEFHNKLK